LRIYLLILRMNLDKVLILNKLKNHFNCGTNSAFAKHLGIAPTTMSSWYSRKTFDIDVLVNMCPGVDWNKVFDNTVENISSSNELIYKDIVHSKREGTYPESNAEIMEYLKEKDEKIIKLSIRNGELEQENKQLRKQKGYDIAAES